MKWHGRLCRTLSRSSSFSKSNWNLLFPRFMPQTLFSTSQIRRFGMCFKIASTLLPSEWNILPTSVSLNFSIRSELSKRGTLMISSSSPCFCLLTGRYVSPLLRDPARRFIKPAKSKTRPFLAREPHQRGGKLFETK